MHARSSLSEVQREAAVAWFEKGIADKATATHAGRVSLAGQASLSAVEDPWSRSAGGQADETGRTRSSSSSHWSNGSSRVRPPRISRRRPACPRRRYCKTWVGAYRREGADALRPKPKGRPRKPDSPPPVELSELERLRRENERLRAEVAYLGKLRALRDAGTTVKVQAVIALKADFRFGSAARRRAGPVDVLLSPGPPPGPRPARGTQGRGHGDLQEEPWPVRAPPHPH